MGRGGEATSLTSESLADYGGLHSERLAPLGKAQIDESETTEGPRESRFPPPSRNEASDQFCPSLIVAIGVGLVAGSMYGFGRYAKDLKVALKISQMTVQRFGILLDTGNYIGHPLTGWIYDRFGPQVSCWSAAFIVFLSYSTIHLGLSSSGPIWMMNLGFLGVGFGSGLGYIAGLGSTTNAYRGTPQLGRAVGLVAAGCGFSSTLVGMTYHLTGLRGFFLLWAVLVAVMNIVGAIVFPAKQTVQDEEAALDAEGDLEERLLSRPRSDLRHQELPIASEDEQEFEWSSWKKIDFWLLFGSFACITGCGLMIINNISTMVESIGGDDALSGYLVVELSICNVTGRILMGSLADHPRLHKLDLYRYASLLMALALLVSAVGGTSAVCLALTVAMAAISYGGSWVLIIGILSDLYGRLNFGKDYGLIAMGPAISGMAFNAYAAKMYESHAHEDSGVCIGSICYRNAFLLTAASATVGYLILLWFLPARPHEMEKQDPVPDDKVTQGTIE